MSGRILCGDARKALDEVADESVHLVLTSPPYNVGIEYDDHDDLMLWDDWVELVSVVLEKAWQKLVPGGRMAVNTQSGYGRDPVLPLGHMVEGLLLGLPESLYRGPVVWYKRGAVSTTGWGSFGSPSNPVLRGTHEMIYIVSKGDMTRRDRSGDGDARAHFVKSSLDVWEINPQSDQAAVGGHPAPFPSELVRRAVQFYTWPGDHVLDPFAGSGTTGFVSEQLGREWTMVEISERYCEEIHKRTQIFQGIPTAEIEYI